jgi:hypothetical protein
VSASNIGVAAAQKTKIRRVSRMQQAPVAEQKVSTPTLLPQSPLSAHFLVAGIGGRTDAALDFPKTMNKLRQLLLKRGHKGDRIVVRRNDGKEREFESVDVLQTYLAVVDWTKVTVSLANKQHEGPPQEQPQPLQVVAGNRTYWSVPVFRLTYF